MNTERFVADRVKHIGASGIRRVFDLGAQLKDPINLSIGQPDFPVPAAAKDAMISAIRADHNGYTVTRGLPALRQRIAGLLKEELGWEADVFVTSGVSGGLLLSMLACVNPGDEVIFGDPCFVSYPYHVSLAGGVPVPVELYDDFGLHPERIAKAITSRTKVLLLCSPSNPTGVVYQEDALREVVRLAERHDLLIVMDEIYHMLCYDGPSPCPVRLAPDRTLLLRGFAKSYAMTGLRVGYAAGPERIISEMAKLQQYTFVCAPHPVQYGALAALDVDMSEHVKSYKAKRDLVCRELSGFFEFARPSGGFYVFPKAPTRYPSATAFVEEAIKRNVLIIPGEAFSRRDTHFRISYAAPDEKIRQGCAVLRALAEES
ncbi:MAG: aminotransferase class I/II-fold pyridoxal phosphate-dependent enzyme [Phycisphaerae bacterium]|nr:aminotransferase class I/II-fold pyridoxal phosphate-dependent enzyme [Phycisphaerae bacterium]